MRAERGLLALGCLLLPVDERLGVEAWPALAAGDAIVRRVGELEIRASDVFQLLDLAAPGQTGEALDELVLMALVRLEAGREGVDVPAAALEVEVDGTLAEQRARFAVEVRADVPLETFVKARHGWDEQQFRAVVRRGVLGNMLLDRVVRLNTWRRTRDELQVILVTDEALGRDIAAKVAEGASFSVLARQHSEHPSAAEGGSMPPLPVEIDVPLVAGRAGLAPGDVLGPAPITLGERDYWRLVRLVERSPGRPETWAELRGELEADLALRPIHPDELSLFEAAVAGRYRVEDPRSAP